MAGLYFEEFSVGIVNESLKKITTWGAQYRLDQVRSLIRREPRWHRLEG